MKLTRRLFPKPLFVLLILLAFDFAYSQQRARDRIQTPIRPYEPIKPIDIGKKGGPEQDPQIPLRFKGDNDEGWRRPLFPDDFKGDNDKGWRRRLFLDDSEPRHPEPPESKSPDSQLQAEAEANQLIEKSEKFCEKGNYYQALKYLKQAKEMIEHQRFKPANLMHGLIFPDYGIYSPMRQIESKINLLEVLGNWKRAENFIQQEKYLQAAKILDQTFETHSESSLARILNGYSDYLRGKYYLFKVNESTTQYETAEKFFNSASRKYREHLDDLISRDDELEERERFFRFYYDYDAEQELLDGKEKTIVENQLNESKLLENVALGSQAVKNNDLTKAIQCFRTAKQFAEILKSQSYLSASSEAIAILCFEEGSKAFEANDYKMACNDFHEILSNSKDPNLLERANVFLGLSYFNWGNRELNNYNTKDGNACLTHAIKYLDFSIDKTPPETWNPETKDKNLKLLEAKSFAHVLTSNLDEGIATLNKILEIDPTQNKIKLEKGIFLIQNGQIDLGEEILLNTKRVIQESQDKVSESLQAESWYYLSLVSSVKGNYATKAESYLKNAKVIDPDIDKQRDADLAVIYANKGWQDYLNGRFNECISASSQAIALDPSLETAYYNLGLAHLTLGQKFEAFIEYERAIVTDKNLEVIEAAIKDLTNAHSAGKITDNDCSYGKHFLYFNRGLVEAEMGYIEHSKESFRNAQKEKKLILASSVQKILFSNGLERPASSTMYAANSLFYVFANKPKEILKEAWLPIGTREIRVVDSPEKTFRFCGGVLEVSGNLQLQELRERFEENGIIDEMTEMVGRIQENDVVVVNLSKNGSVFVYPSSNGNTLVADLLIQPTDMTRLASAHIEAQNRLKDRFTLKKFVDKLKKGETISDEEGLGFTEPIKILDTILKNVGRNVKRIIVKSDQYTRDLDFRNVQAVLKLAKKRKHIISVRMDQPQLFRTLENVRKPARVSMKQSVFLVTLPLDQESFNNSNFGKAQIEKELNWEDYERTGLKQLKETVSKLSKWYGSENVILNATRNDFLNMLQNHHFLTLTLITEHNINETAIEMKDGLWNMKQIAEDIGNIKSPDGQILYFITCKGEGVLPDMFLNNGTALVASSSGEVELSRALYTFRKATELMKKGKEFDQAYDEAEFKVLKDIINGKVNFAPNLRGVPIEKSELDREWRLNGMIEFALY